MAYSSSRRDEVVRTVFLSYAQSDQRTADWLTESLAGEGLTVLAPGRMRPGEEWEKVLARAVRNATWFVVLVSERSVRSSYQTFELGIGFGQGKPLIPIWLSSQAKAEAPPALREIQGPLIRGRPDRAELHRVAREIASAIDRAAGQSTTYRVVYRAGKWLVNGQKANRPLGAYATKSEATRRAIGLAQIEVLGEVVLYTKGGAIQSQLAFGQSQYAPNASD